MGIKTLGERARTQRATWWNFHYLIFYIDGCHQRSSHTIEIAPSLNTVDSTFSDFGYNEQTSLQCLSLPPATKLGQGNIFRSVCQEFFSRGGLPHCMLGYPPPPRDQRQARATSGRYSSYWNAVLLTSKLKSLFRRGIRSQRTLIFEIFTSCRRNPV